jgi:hypothetical protein
MRQVLAALAVAVAAIAAPAYAQTTPAERAADSLVSASVIGVSEVMAAQFPSVFERAGDFSADELAQLRTKLEYLPGRVREAMEQRWTPRELPPLPAELQSQLNQMLGSTVAGQRGELDARRPPTREVVLPELSRRFSEAQLAEIAAFLETPAGMELTRARAAGIVRRTTPAIADLPAEHRATAQAFSDTPSGRAYFAELQPLMQTIVEQLRLNTMEHGRDLMTEVAVAYCEVTPECFAEMGSER